MIAFRDPARSRRLAVEHRDEGGGKGALGKEGAEHVGQAEGDPVEGVRREARPDIARRQRIAHQREYPAGERQPADGTEGLGELHGKTSPPVRPELVEGLHFFLIGRKWRASTSSARTGGWIIPRLRRALPVRPRSAPSPRPAGCKAPRHRWDRAAAAGSRHRGSRRPARGGRRGRCGARSEAARVGKAGVSPCRSRWSPYPQQKNTKKN